jgi:hypothetical protein
LEIFQGPKRWQHNENIRSGDVELDENALSICIIRKITAGS